MTGIADTLRGYIGGHVPTRFREDNDLFDLRVLVPERELVSRNDVEDLVQLRRKRCVMRTLAILFG